MALYKREFGESFNLGFNLADYPWLTDKSWHNDMSPSFFFKVGIQQGLIILDRFLHVIFKNKEIKNNLIDHASVIK